LGRLQPQAEPVRPPILGVSRLQVLLSLVFRTCSAGREAVIEAGKVPWR
jgi:hypothetical protein